VVGGHACLCVAARRQVSGELHGLIFKKRRWVCGIALPKFPPFSALPARSSPRFTAKGSAPFLAPALHNTGGQALVFSQSRVSTIPPMGGMVGFCLTHKAISTVLLPQKSDLSASASDQLCDRASGMQKAGAGGPRDVDEGRLRDDPGVASTDVPIRGGCGGHGRLPGEAKAEPVLLIPDHGTHGIHGKGGI
jgi:hypothetical protein